MNNRLRPSEKLALARSERHDLIREGGEGGALVNVVDDVVRRLGAARYDEAAKSDLRAMTLDLMRRDPKLVSVVQRNPASFVASFVQVLRLGLEVDPALQHVHLIPRGSECTVMLGYRGLMELARRSPEVRRIRARAVRPGDAFECVMGTTERLHHVPAFADGDPVEYTHAYAVVEYVDGGTDFEVLTYAECQRIRQQSRGGPVWDAWPVEMAKKTAIRRLCKRLPLTRESAAGIAADDTGDAPPLRTDGASTAGVAPQHVPDEAPAVDAAPEPVALDVEPERYDLTAFGAWGANRVAAALDCDLTPGAIAKAAVERGVTQRDLLAVAAEPDEGIDAAWMPVDSHAKALRFFDGVDLGRVGEMAGVEGDDPETLAKFAVTSGASVEEVLDVCWRSMCGGGR